jgi:hypothetical protein
MELERSSLKTGPKVATGPPARRLPGGALMATSANVIGYDWRVQRDGRTRRPRDCRLRECDDDRGGTRIAGSHCGCAPVSLPLAVADLGEICSGTVYLSVPLLNDIIQVGAGGKLATGTIQVSKTPFTVTVRRTDGRPIQAEILHEHQGYTGPAVRAKVFEEPVNCLSLQRISSGHGPLWLAAEAVHVDRRHDLQQFVNTIATFGLAKQRKMSGREKPPACRQAYGGQHDIPRNITQASTHVGECASSVTRLDGHTRSDRIRKARP